MKVVKNNCRITVIQIHKKMPSLWESKVAFVSVSQFLGLALCSPFRSVSGHFVALIVSLGRRKKRKKKEGGWEESSSKKKRKKK